MLGNNDVDLLLFNLLLFKLPTKNVFQEYFLKHYIYIYIYFFIVTLHRETEMDIFSCMSWKTNKLWSVCFQLRSDEGICHLTMCNNMMELYIENVRKSQ